MRGEQSERVNAMRRVVAMLALAATILVGSPVPAAASASCAFQLGFATLATLLPQQVGQCLDDEGHNPANGDGLQHTSGGLLVWRKSDNWTAFTDGFHTWVNGPRGLQERLNTQRFAWEANPDGLAIAGDSAAPADRTAPAPTGGGATIAITAAQTSSIAGSVDPSISGTAGHAFYAGATATSAVLYCDDDAEWQAVPPASLRRFDTWAQVRAAYPDRPLNRPC